ncbi:hypothetical protein NIES2100_05350 [Calothrix sp. NIES-2100]|uniref:hypothetical protein n=1 Tax=Calothrix sp. NIES-2100 TaxID=1954172 RepID=UPI000B61530E|nr:hypothetical protein NIES2100_05350 [Calothrix sp. NIES-2100]
MSEIIHNKKLCYNIINISFIHIYIMLTTRLVVGKIYRTNGDVLTSSKILFKLLNSSYIADGQIVKSEIIADIDNQGNLYTTTDLGSIINGVRLWCNEQGDIASEYACFLPGNEVFKFTLPSGNSDIQLSVLRQAGITQNDPQYNTLATYVDNLVNSKGTGKISIPFSYGDASPKILINSFQGLVDTVTIQINQVFNEISLLSITDSSNQTLLSSDYCDVTTVASYESYPFFKYENSVDIFLNIQLGNGVNQGNGFVVLGIKEL